MSDAFEVSTITTVAFWVGSGLAIAGALLVVTLRDVFRAAMALALTFIGIAGLFFLLSAEFVAVVQVLVYVGAVSILIAFAVMMIKDVAGGSLPSRGRILSATIAALVMAAVTFVAYNTEWTGISSLDNDAAVAGLAGTFVETDQATAGGTVRIVSPAGADVPEASRGVLVDSTGSIGALLIRQYVLPFEAVALLLVAALIGGLALMRREPAQ